MRSSVASVSPVPFRLEIMIWFLTMIFTIGNGYSNNTHYKLCYAEPIPPFAALSVAGSFAHIFRLLRGPPELNRHRRGTSSSVRSLYLLLLQTMIRQLLQHPHDAAFRPRV